MGSINDNTLKECIKTSTPLFYACEACRKLIMEKKLNTDFDEQMDHMRRQNIEMSNTIRSLQTKIDRIQLSEDGRTSLEARIILLEEENTILRSTKRNRTIAEKEHESAEISQQIGSIVRNMLAKELQPIHQAIQAISSSNTQVPVVTFEPLKTKVIPSSQIVTPRARNASRSHTPIRKTTVATKMSYAEVMHRRDSAKEAVRNIRICDPTDTATILAIQKEEIAKQINITKCSTKSNDFLTVICANTADAEKLDEALSTKYGDKIAISKAVPTIPRFKITNMPEDTSEITIIEELKEYTYWLRDAMMEVDRVYKVDNGKRIYCNAIISCDIKTLKFIIDRGSIIYGLRERYCFEHVHVMQCSNCWQFGHTLSSCKGQTRCKRCSGVHKVTECTSATMKCTNCSIHNRTSDMNFDTRHIASSDLCKMKQERIDGLKNYHFSKKN